MSYTSPIIKTSDWNAWVDMRPPKPNTLYVTGKVTLSSSNYELDLVQVPVTGKDKRSLLLLRLAVFGEGATEDVTEREVRFTIKDYSPKYNHVQIMTTTDFIPEIREAH